MPSLITCLGVAALWNMEPSSSRLLHAHTGPYTNNRIFFTDFDKSFLFAILFVTNLTFFQLNPFSQVT